MLRVAADNAHLFACIQQAIGDNTSSIAGCSGDNVHDDLHRLSMPRGHLPVQKHHTMIVKISIRISAPELPDSRLVEQNARILKFMLSAGFRFPAESPSSGPGAVSSCVACVLSWCIRGSFQSSGGRNRQFWLTGQRWIQV